MLKFNVHKSYRSKKRKIEISCNGILNLGITTAIYGHSGVGKSTVLRILSGLEKPDHGEIHHGDQVWYNDQVCLSPKQRKVGYVFQDFNLFPNMTVKRNLQYAGQNRRISSEIEDLMQATGLIELLNEYPNTLSGGQKQRVAIVRALCQSPDILFLDEPFSALDDDSIRLLIDEIDEIQRRKPMTVALISHRKDVVFAMAKEVILMHKQGACVQGEPGELLDRNL